MESAVPVMWAVCGGLIYTAWNRVDEKSGQENVDKVRFPLIFSTRILVRQLTYTPASHCLNIIKRTIPLEFGVSNTA